MEAKEVKKIGISTLLILVVVFFTMVATKSHKVTGNKPQIDPVATFRGVGNKVTGYIYQYEGSTFVIGEEGGVIKLED